MPLYDFQCRKCGKFVEYSCSYDSRMEARQHCVATETKCRGELMLAFISAPRFGAEKRHMGAVMYQGETKVGHVKGHFGKTSLIRKSKST